MIPTLRGRLQTRLFAVAILGGLWTLLITPLLPSVSSSVDLGERYRITLSIVAAMLVLSIFWEIFYHGAQQWRWEKDWPTQWGFLTGINEGALLWLVVSNGLIPNVDDSIAFSTFITHFATTWIVIFLFLNGPMKVVFIRWRFRGGRLIGK